MKDRPENREFLLQRFFEYLKTIDKNWLTTWVIIFVGFIVLDLAFQLFYRDSSFYSSIEFGKHIVNLPIVDHGTFIGVTVLKIAGIFLSFVYAFSKFRKDYTLQIALLFTFLADILLLLDNSSAVGVFVFCLAQYFHLARFKNFNPKYFIFYNFFLASVIIIAHFTFIPSIYILGFIYAITLLLNIYTTHYWHKKSERELFEFKDNNQNTPDSNQKLTRLARTKISSDCAFFGFLLFLFCDINVALSFIARTHFAPVVLVKLFNFFAWAFYYPSQVLISNSSDKIEKSSKFLAKK